MSFLRWREPVRYQRKHLLIGYYSGYLHFLDGRRPAHQLGWQGGYLDGAHLDFFVLAKRNPFQRQPRRGDQCVTHVTDLYRHAQARGDGPLSGGHIKRERQNVHETDEGHNQDPEPDSPDLQPVDLGAGPPHHDHGGFPRFVLPLSARDR